MCISGMTGSFLQPAWPSSPLQAVFKQYSHPSKDELSWTRHSSPHIVIRHPKFESLTPDNLSTPQGSWKFFEDTALHVCTTQPTQLQHGVWGNRCFKGNRQRQQLTYSSKQKNHSKKITGILIAHNTSRHQGVEHLKFQTQQLFLMIGFQKR